MVKDNTSPHRAGRGALAIAGAKAYFIVCGYSVQFLLPRIFEGKAVFGRFSSIMNLASIINNVLVVATIQTVSKFVSEEPAQGQVRLRQGLKAQLLIGAFLCAGLALGAPWLAQDVLLDSQLEPLLQTVSIVMMAYALYAAMVGYFNGMHRFVPQAGLDITFSTLRTAGILGAAVLGYGALGAMTGFAAAAIAILLVAVTFAGIGHAGEPIPWRRWLGFSLPLWIYQIFLNSIMQIDLLVLKRTVAELSMNKGMSAFAAAELASRYVGEYRAAQTFAFVPYQLILAVAFVVFPMVSQASSSGDMATARQTIRSALRFSLIVLFAIAAPVAGAAEGVLRIAYPTSYVTAAGALQILAFGIAALALFVIAATALSGSGNPGKSAVIAGFGLIVVIGLNRVFVQHTGIGDRTLEAAALGTSCGTFCALALIAVVMRWAFGPCLPLLSAARTVGAAAIAFWTAHLIPHVSAAASLIALVASGMVYLLILLALGEFRRDELRRIGRWLKR